MKVKVVHQEEGMNLSDLSSSSLKAMTNLRSAVENKLKLMKQDHILEQLCSGGIKQLNEENNDEDNRKNTTFLHSLLTDLNSVTEVDDNDDDDLKITFEKASSFSQQKQRQHKSNNNNNNIFSASTTPTLVPAEIDVDLTRMSEQELDEMRKCGLEAIGRGELAVITLAGGVSTKLSISSRTMPKGTCQIQLGLLSGKSTFQLQAERLTRIQHLAKVNSPIAWYIMTSEVTDQATREFFEANDYFQLDKSGVHFFKQFSLPCFQRHSRQETNTTSVPQMILDNDDTKGRGHLLRMPDGSGGLFKALSVRRELLDDMRKRNVKFVHIYNVENVLVRVADPIFTGVCLTRRLECACKVVQQNHKREPLNLVRRIVTSSTTNSSENKEKNDKLFLQNAATLRESTRDFFLGNTNTNSSRKNIKENCGEIGCYFLSLDLLSQIVHRHYPDNSNSNNAKIVRESFFTPLVHKTSNLNCIKFETFLTDYLPKNVSLVNVNRKQEYSPLKNMMGTRESEHYTRIHCKDDLVQLHYSWLLKAGAIFHFPGEPSRQIKNSSDRNDQSINDDLPTLCEISPLVSYEGENLRHLVENRSFEPPLVLEFDQETNTTTFNGCDFETFNKAYSTTEKPVDKFGYFY